MKRSNQFFSLVILTAFATVYAAPTNSEDCAMPTAPENGAVQTVYSLSNQLLAVFTCNEDYAAVGDTVLTCSNGEWENVAPICASVEHCNLKARTIKIETVDPSILKCGELSPPRFGRISVTVGADGLSEIASFSCVPGYYVSGTSALHCERGVWSGREPECKPIDCGAPEGPVNGTVEYEDTHFMAKANYKCDACHVLVGQESRVCKRSGLWSKTTPECIKRDDIAACSLPIIPGGGFIPGENNLLENGVACGEIVKISCFNGRRLLGASTATCNPDGTYSWHGNTPQCRLLGWI